MKKFKAFSLLEIVAVLAVIAILSTVAVGTYNSVRNQTTLTVAESNLTTTQLEARKILSESIMETNSVEFPSDLVDRLDIQGVSFTNTASTNEYEVSLSLPSTTILVLASKAGDDCIVLVDKLNSTKNWGVRKNFNDCRADVFNPFLESITGNSSNPTVIL